MQPLVQRFGSQRAALAELEKAAQTAFDAGKLNMRGTIHKITEISVGGFRVNLIGGRVINGIFRVSSASMRGLQ